MDRLVVETEVEEKVEKEEPKQNVEVKPLSSNASKVLPVHLSKEPQIQTEYLNSLENITIADIKKEENVKKQEEFKVEKETLIQQQFDLIQQQFDETQKQELQKVEQQESQKIVEKPNYDLISEPKRVIKLKSKPQEKKKVSKKAVGIALACALGISGVICVTNTIIIDNMSSNFVQIDETYKLNLAKYLKDIANLDTTKQGMEFLESYPEENLDAGDLGAKTNWFDRLCNFIGGLFGG